MNKNNIIITIKKELRSIFRDKKTLMMILCFPFIIVGLIFLFGQIQEIAFDKDETTTIGINYDLSSIEKTLLNECKLKSLYNKDLNKLKEYYEAGKIEVFVEFDEAKNKYIIYSNGTTSSATAVSKVTAYLESYNKYLGDLYIKGEGIDPEVVYKNFDMEIKSAEGKEISFSDLLLPMVMNMTFVYIISSIALATINMATSAIAVEKENGTLETILTLPITTKELVLGKYLATVIIGAFSSIISFSLSIISFGIGTKMFTIYKNFNIGVMPIVIGILVCIVASFFIGALSIAITSNSRSYKEAQAAGQILAFACMLPMLLSFLEVKISNIYYLIPILNHTTILMDLYSNKFSYSNIFITIISTIIYSIILIIVLIKKFRSEKVLFGA